MELMTPHGGTLFWTAVTFVVLLLILSKFAWKPILQGLAEREAKIKESLEAAEKAKLEVQDAAGRQEKILEEAKKEAQEILAKSRNSAELIKEEIVEKAKKEAEGMVETAQRSIELSRDKAIEEIKTLAVELSMAATQQLIGKSLDKSDHESIIRSSLQKMRDLN